MYINLFIYLYIYSHTMHLHCSIYTLYHGNCSIIYYHSSFQHTVFTCFYWWFGAFGGLDSDFSSPYERDCYILSVPRFESLQPAGFHPVEVISALKLNFNTNRLKAGRSMGTLVFRQQLVGFDGGWYLCLQVGFQCDVNLCVIYFYVEFQNSILIFGKSCIASITYLGFVM